MDRTAVGGSSHGGDERKKVDGGHVSGGDAGATVGSEGIFVPDFASRACQLLGRPAQSRDNFSTFLNFANELVGPATIDRKPRHVPFT